MATQCITPNNSQQYRPLMNQRVNCYKCGTSIGWMEFHKHFPTCTGTLLNNPRIANSIKLIMNNLDNIIKREMAGEKATNPKTQVIDMSDDVGSKETDQKGEEDFPLEKIQFVYPQYRAVKRKNKRTNEGSTNKQDESIKTSQVEEEKSKKRKSLYKPCLINNPKIVSHDRNEIPAILSQIHYELVKSLSNPGNEGLFEKALSYLAESDNFENYTKCSLWNNLMIQQRAMVTIQVNMMRRERKKSF